MPSFAYVAKDRSGKTVQGVLDAANQQEVVARLRQDNMLITRINAMEQTRSIKIGASAAGSTSGSNVRGRVNLREKMFFTKQFHVMMRAGLGLVTCLNQLIAQTKNKFFQHTINEVRKDIESGQSISMAMGKHPKVFDKMFVNMLEAGEASGKLDLSLSRMNDYYEREYNLKKKIIGAMIYPAVISSVAFVVVLLMFAVVLPTFAGIFKDAGVQLPMITQVLMAIGEFVRNFWFLIPIFFFGLFFGYKLVKKDPKGSEYLDQMMLKMPIIGNVMLKLVVSRFTQTFSTLLESGVPLLQSMEIVQKAVNNAVIAKGIRNASVSVSRGTGLAKPLESSGLFPPMVSQMIAIGEETGDLSHMLEEVAMYYDKEAEYAIESLTAMLEPMIIVVLGGIIGFIVSAIMIPMLQMSSGATLKM